MFANKEDFLYFIRKYIAASWTNSIDENDMVKVDKSYVSKEYRNTTSDIIYKLKLNGDDVYLYILMEMQSTLDNTMPFRLLQYMTALLTDIFDNDKKIRNKVDYKLPAIVPILLYNGTDEWNITQEYKQYTKNSEIFGDNIINFKYLLFDLNRTDEKVFEEATKTLVDYILQFDYKRNETDINDIKKQIPKIAKDLNADDLAKLSSWIRHTLYGGKLPPKIEEEIIAGFAKGEGNMTHAFERWADRQRRESKNEGRREERQAIITKLKNYGLSDDEIKKALSTKSKPQK